MPQIEIGSHSFNLYDQGNGEVLVFVHGFPLDHSMWQPHLDRLVSDYRVIAPDLRGLGKSHAKDSITSMREHASDLLAILNKLNITEPVNWIGLSMGGYVLWQVMHLAPDSVKRMILCDTRANSDSDEVRSNRRKTAERVLTEGTLFLVETMIPRLVSKHAYSHNPELLKSLSAMIINAPPGGVAACSLGMADREDMTLFLPRINKPVLVICGEDDAITPEHVMKEFANHIPNSQFSLIPQAGHLAPMEQPEIFEKLLLEFMEHTE